VDLDDFSDELVESLPEDEEEDWDVSLDSSEGMWHTTKFSSCVFQIGLTLIIPVPDIEFDVKNAPPCTWDKVPIHISERGQQEFTCLIPDNVAGERYSWRYQLTDVNNHPLSVNVQTRTRKCANVGIDGCGTQHLPVAFGAGSIRVNRDATRPNKQYIKFVIRNRHPHEALIAKASIWVFKKTLAPTEVPVTAPTGCNWSPGVELAQHESLRYVCKVTPGLYQISLGFLSRMSAAAFEVRDSDLNI
jgi:hypothetical protein